MTLFLQKVEEWLLEALLGTCFGKKANILWGCAVLLYHLWRAWKEKIIESLKTGIWKILLSIVYKTWLLGGVQVKKIFGLLIALP